MHKQSARIILYSSLAIVLLVFMWGLRQIPSEGRLADQALRESLNQEVIVLNGAVKAATSAMKYRLLDVLKAEGNDHATRAFQDSPFLAATLLEWNQVEWKSLWYSTKSKTEMQAGELKKWLNEWPLAKIESDEVYFTKVGMVDGQAYFAMIVPVRKPNQVPMMGVGIFPAAQFGLNFSSDENREIRVFTHNGYALALSHPAYLGASVRGEPLVREMLDGDDVGIRHEWKTDLGVKMLGVSSRVGDSNLMVAIESKAVTGSKLAAWSYLILCALGAGILNWVLFSAVFRAVIAQVSAVEEVNRELRRQLNGQPAATAGGAAIRLEGDPAIPAHELDLARAIAEAESAPMVRTGTSPAGATAVPATESGIPAGGLPAAEATPLNKIVTSSLRSLDKKIQEAKISVMHFGLEDLALKTDTLQLQTAIEEVLKNAIEAMASVEARNLTISGRKTSSGLKLIVEDTGGGIADADMPKVFDPFFSTKDSEGVARGLGLNVVRRVVEELNGSVKLFNTGGGTRAEIDLPDDKSAVDAAEIPFPPEEVEMESEEFTVAGIPSLNFEEKEWPEISVRKPVVRTLD